VSKEWDQMSEEMNAAIMEWREQHPRATFREIEAEIDRRLDELRGKMMSDTVNLSTNPQWERAPAITEIDTWIDFYFQVTHLNRPYTIEWTGNIHVPSRGHYLFGLECRDSSTLWIDNKHVLDDKTPDQYQEAGIDLAAGLHSLRIRYTDKTGYTHIYLYWTSPGADREIIPQEVLFPPQGDPESIKAH
jgi:hypothetical protein